MGYGKANEEVGEREKQWKWKEGETKGKKKPLISAPNER